MMNQILYFLEFEHFQEFLFFIMPLDKQNHIGFVPVTSAFLDYLEYLGLPFLFPYYFDWERRTECQYLVSLYCLLMVTMNYNVCFRAVSFDNSVGYHVFSWLKGKRIEKHNGIFHVFLN